MQFLPLVVLAALATFESHPAITRTDPVLVRAVIDGDTIDVSTYGRVRLLGIDAPEIGRGFDTSAPFSREARDRLSALVLHRWIRLEQEGPKVDVYDRRLAYVVTEDGVFVNAVLVREGLARVTARVPLSRLPELERAETEAQAARRGMWGVAPSITSPSYTRPLPQAKAPAGKSRKGGQRKRHGRRSR